MSQNEPQNDFLADAVPAPAPEETLTAPMDLPPTLSADVAVEQAPEAQAAAEPAPEAPVESAEAAGAETEPDSAVVVQSEAPFVPDAAQTAEEAEQIVHEEPTAEPLPPIRSEMLVSVVPGEECRIAITVDGKLDDFFQEKAGAESHVGGIYKGRIRQINTAVQAAFVDIGLPQNAFLHISDVHPRYFPGSAKEAVERVGIKTARRDRPPIQQCFKKGDEVLVQIIKEGVSATKGPTVTAYLSVPGRYIVMMPWMDELGVSKKVEDQRTRAEMRDMLRDLAPPEGFGFILRTEAVGKSIDELRRDLNYLTRVWQNMDAKRAALKGLGELYAESDLVIRTLRDIYTAETQRIIVDDLAAARRCRDFLKATDPNCETQVLYYEDEVPLFHRKDIESQIQSISDRTVPLPSGGALVIDQTEAMVAIDVNSGRSRSARDAETNAYETNKEAVDEICRQLRLRDLGGIVCLDLIDMFQIGHRKKIEQRLLQNLKRDRAKTNVGIISPVCGVLPMTRQRMRPSISKSLYQPCPHCVGTGHVATPETTGNAVLRRLQMVLNRADVSRVELTVSGDVAFILLNTKRGQLAALEKQCQKQVLVRVGGRPDAYDIAAYSAYGVKLTTSPQEDILRLPAEPATLLRDLDDPSLPEDVGAEFREDDLILQDHAEAAAVKPPEKPAPKLAQPTKPFAPKPKAEGEAKPEKQERRNDRKPEAQADRQEKKTEKKPDQKQEQKPKQEQKQEQKQGGQPAAPGFELPPGVPVPPKNFPGAHLNQARARVGEVMEALGVSEDDMVAFVRLKNLDRIQSIQTRMTREEVLMAWAHFKGDGAVLAAPAPEATPAPEHAAPAAQPAAPAETGGAPTAKVFVLPVLPEALAAQEAIRVHDLTEIVGMSVTKVNKIAQTIGILNLKSGQSTVDAATAARLLDACGRAKAAGLGLPVAEPAAETKAPELAPKSAGREEAAPAASTETSAAPEAEEAAPKRRGGYKGKAVKESAKEDAKPKAQAKAEEATATVFAAKEEPDPEPAKATPAKGKKGAVKGKSGRNPKEKSKAAPEAKPEPKAEAKVKAEPKAEAKKQEEQPASAAPKFRKRQAPPVPGEAAKKKVFGGAKRGRE